MAWLLHLDFTVIKKISFSSNALHILSFVGYRYSVWYFLTVVGNRSRQRPPHRPLITRKATDTVCHGIALWCSIDLSYGVHFYLSVFCWDTIPPLVDKHCCGWRCINEMSSIPPLPCYSEIFPIVSITSTAVRGYIPEAWRFRKVMKELSPAVLSSSRKIVTSHLCRFP